MAYAQTDSRKTSAFCFPITGVIMQAAGMPQRGGSMGMSRRKTTASGARSRRSATGTCGTTCPPHFFQAGTFFFAAPPAEKDDDEDLFKVPQFPAKPYSYKKFKELAQAYEVLSDPEKQEIYDVMR